LAVVAAHPPPVLVNRLLFLGFALPVTSPFLLLLWNVATYLVALHSLDYRAAVIALVGNQLFDPVDVHLRLLAGPQLGLAPDLLRHCHPRLAQRLVQRCRGALVRALPRPRH